jgi:hypothetical protein
MIRRSIVLNNIEPAALSLRHPLGVNGDLALTVRNQKGEVLDQAPLYPLLILLPRSQGGVDPYDMEVDIADNSSRALVHGSALTDPAGYGLEVYQREAGDPPTSTALMARGVLATEGSAYGAKGRMIMANPVVVTGPPGPPGPSGARGAYWFTGNGPPGALTSGVAGGDMYLDKLNGDIWQFNGSEWILT